MKKSLYLLLLLLLLSGCSTTTTPQPALPEQPQPTIQTGSVVEVPSDPVEDTSPTPPFTRRSSNPILDQITLPEGFEIDLFAEVDNARSMEVVETEYTRYVFVGNRKGDNVYVVIDENKDGYGDEVIELVSGRDMPNGVAYKDGDLYVTEKDTIHKFPAIIEQITDRVETYTSEIVYNNLPNDNQHGWKYIAFGPDGLLYVPIGAPCNVCDAEDPYSSLTRIDLETGRREIIARGIRNTVGFDRDPTTGDLRFTDNGRDRMGDDVPVDELNHMTEVGQHFGFPYCHQGDVQDPEFDTRGCDEFTAPIAKLGPHVAALGMKFYDGEMFPEEYSNQVFIAEHGSRNRSIATGYQLSLVDPMSGSYNQFAYGRNQNGTTLGRPVDVVLLDDGSLLLSDDNAGLIYRILYVGNDEL